MPKVDLTITISVVIAVCAIISPILTAIINNHHQAKMRKLEIKAAHSKERSYYERKIYEDFIKAAYKCFAHADAPSMQEYGEAFAYVRLYMPEEHSKSLDELNGLMRKYEWAKAQAAIENLIPVIHKQIQKS